MIYVLYTFHAVISIFLILVVLLQRGRGADLSVFGGGATQAAFGARGQASLLHRLTVTCFVLFILTTLSIGLIQASGRPSVMDEVATPAAATEPATLPDDEADELAGGSLEPAPAEDDAADDEPPSDQPPDDDGGSESGAGSN